MRTLRLYPPQTIAGESYKDVKVVTVPHQSMSLKEILNRFIKKESLPVFNEGYYAEHLGDLEKMAREDLTVRHERAAEIKEKIRQAQKKHAEDEAKAKASEAAKKEAGGSGEPLKGATPPVQTPPPTPPPGPFPGSHS